MIICPVYLCVFYLSFLEIGLVKIEFVALFSDKMLFHLPCICDMAFRESRFCKKKKAFI